MAEDLPSIAKGSTTRSVSIRSGWDSAPSNYWSRFRDNCDSRQGGCRRFVLTTAILLSQERVAQERIAQERTKAMCDSTVLTERSACGLKGLRRSE